MEPTLQFLNVFETIVTFEIFSQYFNLNKRYRSWFRIIFYVIDYIILDVFAFNTRYYEIYLLIFFAECLLYGLIFSSDSFKEIIAISLIMVLLTSIIRTGIVLVFSLIKYNDLSIWATITSNYYRLLQWITRLIVLILFYLITRVKKKFYSEISNKELNVILIVISGILLIYMPLELFMFYNLTSAALIYAFILFSLLISGGIIFIYYLIFYNREVKDTAIKLTVLQYETKKNLEIKEMYNRTVTLKHNLKHVLNNAIVLAKNNENEKLISELEQYNEQVNSIKPLKIPSSPLIEYLLNRYREIANEKKIDFTCVINSDCQFAADDNDISILLGNALENAIENCSGEKFITVEIKQNKERIIVRITNSTALVKSDTSNLASSKLYGEHGYGISSMKDIVKRNQGKIIFESNDNQFSCRIAMKHK